MKTIGIIASLVALHLGAVAFAQTDAELLDQELRRENEPKRSRSKTSSSPTLDPRRIINESNAFLQEREPEMTAEEYAIYEKSVRLLGQRPEFAVRLLEAMMKEGEQPSPAFAFILANAYYLGGDPAKSEQYYRAAVEAYPSFLRAWVNLGILYHTSDRFADAAKAFARAMSLGDRDPETCGLLGYSLEKSDDLIGAEVAYMQALAGDPEKLDWKEGLLRVCIQGRQFSRAESIVRHLIHAHPQESRFWVVYANLLLSSDRKLESMAILQAAVAAGRAGPDEQALLGDLYAEHGLVPEAVAAYEALGEDSSSLGASKLAHYAEVLIAVRRLEDAERVIASLEQRRGGADSRLLRLRAELYLAQERWTDARAVLETVLAIAPLDGAALLSLGRTHLAEADLPRATLAFEAALHVPESTYRACLELANIELRNRRFRKSCEYLEQALTLHRTDAVEDYLARIRPLAEFTPLPP